MPTVTSFSNNKFRPFAAPSKCPLVRPAPLQPFASPLVRLSRQIRATVVDKRIAKTLTPSTKTVQIHLTKSHSPLGLRLLSV